MLQMKVISTLTVEVCTQEELTIDVHSAETAYRCVGQGEKTAS